MTPPPSWSLSSPDSDLRGRPGHRPWPGDLPRKRAPQTACGLCLWSLSLSWLCPVAWLLIWDPCRLGGSGLSWVRLGRSQAWPKLNPRVHLRRILEKRALELWAKGPGVETAPHSVRRRMASVGSQRADRGMPPVQGGVELLGGRERVWGGSGPAALARGRTETAPATASPALHPAPQPLGPSVPQLPAGIPAHSVE